MRLLGSVFSFLLLVGATLAVSSYLNDNDQARFENILLSGLSSDDVGVLNHAINGLTLLGKSIPDKKNLCKKLQNKSERSSEAVFHISKATSALGCTFKPESGVRDKLESKLVASNGIAEIYYATGALSTLGYRLETSKILKAINGALKKDDSITSLGQAFHIAAILDGDVSSIFDRVEDAIVQGDQVDGKMLQFEGGLSVTALVISGAYKLSEAVGRSPPITKEQANKFAEYFVSRRSVQTVKGVHFLLNVASIFSDNKFHIPVAITLTSKAVVSLDAPKFQVKVTDILGKNVKGLNVVADSATRIADDAVVLSQKPLTSKAGMHELDLMSTNPGKGVYRVVLSASASRTDSRLVGNVGTVVVVKVLTRIDIDDAEIGTADSDQSTATKLKKVVFPNKLDGVLEADTHQKVVIKFQLRDTTTKELLTVHQAFVRLTHKESHQEIFFVAEPDVNDVYKFDLDVASKAKDFLYLSGLYSVNIIIGDAVIENPTVWNLAELELKFGRPSTGKSNSVSDMYLPKPEIQHVFRQPEKRPPALVSNTFTILVITPLVVFVGLVAKLGVGPSTMSLSLGDIAFHCSLGGIFTLFVAFWLYLNMFQTLKLLFLLAIPTMITGRYMLSRIAEKRKISNK